MELTNSELVSRPIATTVYKQNLKAVSDGYRIIVNEGGTGSGKTQGTLLTIATIASQCFDNRIVSICSESLPHLRLGAMRDLDILTNHQFKVRDTNYEIRKNQIEFFGVDNMAKTRGPRRHWLYINEANRIKEEVWNQLEPRTKEIVFIDFNPDREFWAHDLKGRPDVAWIHSTYLDNEALSMAERLSIESRQHLSNWWKVYGLGLLGGIENVIYTDWEIGAFDESLPHSYGLDFGFSASPDALVKVAIDHKRKFVYLKELMYDTGNSSDELKRKLIERTTVRVEIIADSAEDRLIVELKKDFNIKGASKYGGSVKDGIKILQSYKIIADPGSPNLIKELKYYRWNDRASEIPEKGFDHLLDAARYNVLTRVSGGGRTRTKVI